jgi:uncharacterized membrane protein YGL010W
MPDFNFSVGDLYVADTPALLQYYLTAIMVAFAIAIVQSTIRGDFSGVSGLAKNIAFYKSYHSNPVNVFIHLLCIWPILWTSFYFLAFTVPVFEVAGHPVNFQLVIGALYALCYLFMDSFRLAGILGAALAGGALVTSKHIAEQGAFGFSADEAFTIISAVHVFAWIAQFYGHGVHEGRKPALFTNLAQAFIMAPLFVLIECLWSVGLYKELQQQAKVMSGELIKAYKTEQKAQGKKKQ